MFLEPVYNDDFRANAVIGEDGRLVKYYKPHRFRSLIYNVCTVLMYGCGLRPSFKHCSSDAVGTRVLNMVLGTLAISDKISPNVKLSHPKIAIVVNGDRTEMLATAREISRCLVVTNALTRSLTYSFKHLPERIEEELGVPCIKSGIVNRVQYGVPDRFLHESGSAAFSQLTRLWPSVTQRGDVKHPACSKDPRWTGLMLCLAEWQGRTEIVDTVTQGTLEALRLNTMTS